MLDYFTRLETLDYLIRSKRTGAPRDLARRLKISERTLYDFLEVMRSLGAPIEYCKLTKTYYYTEKGSFNIRFKKAIRSLARQLNKNSLNPFIIAALMMFHLAGNCDLLEFLDIIFLNN